MPAPNHDFPHKWVGESYDENRALFLAAHPEAENLIDMALEVISETPYSPPFRVTEWKGEESDHWRVAEIDDHVSIVFEISALHPWVHLALILYN